MPDFRQAVLQPHEVFSKQNDKESAQRRFYLQKYERGGVKRGSLDSSHTCLCEIISPYVTSSQGGHFKLMYMHVKVCPSFAHKHIGRLDRTKLWMTTHCWDEEEAWQHEECLGGIRRHFWFGMVSSMYVMSVSALKEKITCKAAAAHPSRVCAPFLQTQEVLKSSIQNKS